MARKSAAEFEKEFFTGLKKAGVKKSDSIYEPGSLRFKHAATHGVPVADIVAEAVKYAQDPHHKQLDRVVNEAMRYLKSTDFKKHIEKQYRDNMAAAREEAKKEKMPLDRFLEVYPDEWYAYLKFKDDGEITGYDIDHAQYWRGHGGPTVAIFLGPRLDWKEVEREIGNSLADQIREPEGD